MGKLYIMVGLPGSGKTTFRKNNFPGMRYVSRDEIRFSCVSEKNAYFSKEKDVYNMFVGELLCFINQNIDVIADATHLTIASRKKLLNRLSAHCTCPFEVYFVVMKTDLDEVYKRNAQRPGREQVPENEIKKMAERFEFPNKLEHHNVKGIWTITEY